MRAQCLAAIYHEFGSTVSNSYIWLFSIEWDNFLLGYCVVQKMQGCLALLNVVLKLNPCFNFVLEEAEGHLFPLHCLQSPDFTVWDMCN
mgnify:CR=1 FL=1